MRRGEGRCREDHAAQGGSPTFAPLRVAQSGPFDQEYLMPIIAWLLGVPLSVVLLLMLFGVF
jgi:hypothetical protein